MHRIHRSTLRTVVGLAVAAGLVVACGDDDDDDADAPSETTADAAVAPGPPTSGAAEAPATTSPTDSGDVAATTAAEEQEEAGPAVGQGGELTIAHVAVPTQLDPHKEAHGGERVYWFPMYDRLTKIGPGMEVEAMLATDWEFGDDGLSLSMTLRDDVTFHDGTAFDADVVKANIERVQAEGGPAVMPQIAAVDGVEVVSPTEVRFTLNKTAPDLPSKLAGPAGAMMSPASWTSGRDLATDPGDAGSGPYVMDSYIPAERIVYANAGEENWDTEAGPLDRLEVVFMSDPRARIAAIQTGEIDVTWIPADPNDITEAESLAESGDLQYIRNATGTIGALDLRADAPALADIRVRQALAHAIDREAIVDQLMQGKCTAVDQLYPEGWPGHVEGYDYPFPYDVDEANALLDEAGRPSEPLEIIVIANAPPAQPIAEVIQQQLGEVGIEVVVTPLASVEALGAFREASVEGWQYQVSQALDPAATVEEFILGPLFGFANEDVQAAYDAAQADDDPAVRTAALEELNQVVTEQVVFIPFCIYDGNWLAADNVVGMDDATLEYANFSLEMRYLGLGEE